MLLLTVAHEHMQMKNNDARTMRCQTCCRCAACLELGERDAIGVPGGPREMVRLQVGAQALQEIFERLHPLCMRRCAVLEQDLVRPELCALQMVLHMLWWWVHACMMPVPLLIPFCTCSDSIVMHKPFK